MICSNCKGETDKAYAIYELNKDGTKIWRTDLCTYCESEIFYSNGIIRREHPNLIYKEINE